MVFVLGSFPSWRSRGKIVSAITNKTFKCLFQWVLPQKGNTPTDSHLPLCCLRKVLSAGFQGETFQRVGCLDGMAGSRSPVSCGRALGKLSAHCAISGTPAIVTGPMSQDWGYWGWRCSYCGRGTVFLATVRVVVAPMGTVALAEMPMSKGV